MITILSIRIDLNVCIPFHNLIIRNSSWLWKL